MYEGPYYRCLPASKEIYTLLQAGSIVSSPLIEVTRAYRLPRDGLYTIEYTGQLAYLSEDTMATLQENEVPRSPQILDVGLLASTHVMVQDVHNLQMLEKDEEEERIRIELQAQSQNADNVMSSGTRVKCRVPQFTGTGSTAQRNQIKCIHEKLCQKYPNVISSITGKPDVFRTWFGTGSTSTVNKVFTDSLESLEDDTVTYDMFPSLPTDKCQTNPRCMAYSRYLSGIVHICPFFFDDMFPAMCKSEERPDSRELTLVHEWTHVYSNTKDHVYGAQQCKDLAKNNPTQAINNADNFGYFYCVLTMCHTPQCCAIS